MKTITAILLLMFLIGCSNIKLVPRKKVNIADQTNSDNSGKLICENEKVIGSNITQKVCRTVQQQQEEEEESKTALRHEIDRRNRQPLDTKN